MLIYEFGTSRFQICKSPDKSILLLPRKIFDFCARYDDAGTRVPARKFHTRPGYINTRIFTGLKHTTKKLSPSSFVCLLISRSDTILTWLMLHFTLSTTRIYSGTFQTTVFTRQVFMNVKSGKILLKWFFIVQTLTVYRRFKIKPVVSMGATTVMYV